MGEGSCDAFFLMQRVKAGSLVTGTWHKSKWSALAYGQESPRARDALEAGGEAEDEAGGDAGSGDAASEPSGTKPSYSVPKLDKLPTGVGTCDRVVALTAFKLHGPHPSTVPSSECRSKSTNTANVPGSAGTLAQNNTCKCV